MPVATSHGRRQPRGPSKPERESRCAEPEGYVLVASDPSGKLGHWPICLVVCPKPLQSFQSYGKERQTRERVEELRELSSDDLLIPIEAEGLTKRTLGTQGPKGPCQA